jgi:hypothetical protein
MTSRGFVVSREKPDCVHKNNPLENILFEVFTEEFGIRQVLVNGLGRQPDGVAFGNVKHWAFQPVSVGAHAVLAHVCVLHAVEKGLEGASIAALNQPVRPYLVTFAGTGRKGRVHVLRYSRHDKVFYVII